MENLWKHWQNIKNKLNGQRPKILILDFDGTLAPIAKTPRLAALPKETLEILQNLSKKPEYYLAIISGRSLKDLKAKTNQLKVIYGANHGLEGEIFGKKYAFPLGAEDLRVLKNISRLLKNPLTRFKGAFLEDKKLSLSLHYRLTEPKQRSKVKLEINKILKPFLKDELIRTLQGKMVIDILPKNNWSKGYFVDYIINNLPALKNTQIEAIAIGDDKTDEDIFRHLRSAVTVCVGKKQNSIAGYYLQNTRDVVKFLKSLL